MLLAAKLFLHKDFIKNSNIDVGGGKSVPKILYKVDMCACDGKKENKIHFAKLFCPGLQIDSFFLKKGIAILK